METPHRSDRAAVDPLHRVDRIIAKYRQALTLERNTPVKIAIQELNWLCTAGIEALKRDPNLLELTAPITIVGDLHGQFYDLLEFFKLGGDPPTTKWLFLGDYVDRGPCNVETFAYLLALKIRYPEHVFLLRGNHECPEISRLYGFRAECFTRYDNSMWETFNKVFRWLPLAATIGERIFCVHGGLSEELKSLKDIERLQRPLDIPQQGLLVDMLWADPNPEHQGFQISERGTGHTFGADVAQEFLQKNDFDLICRAHQVVLDGFEFPFNPNQTVLTVFSARNYCDQWGNKGAILKVDAGLRCIFETLDPPPGVIAPTMETSARIHRRRRSVD
jgi:serine/threonine-protein phosphatase PP1 catalytic subunit